MAYSTGTNGIYYTSTTAPFYQSVDWGGVETVKVALKTEAPTEGSKSLNTEVRTVQLMSGHVGQVVTSSPTGERVVLWESKPRKTALKAQRAAQNARLEAVRSTFDWIEA